MTLFIVLAAVLTLAVLSLLAWVARQSAWKRTAIATGRTSASIPGGNELGILNAELELLRIQRQELEQDLEAKRVDGLYREEALVELSKRAEGLLQRRRALEVSRANDQTTATAIPSVSRPERWLLLLAAVLIPLLAAALYLKLGTPAALDFVAAKPVRSDKVDLGGEQVTIAELVRRLEQKLNEQPDQAEGWMLLGHTKYKLGDFAGAVSAFNKALPLAEKRDDLKPILPDLLADLADAQAMQQDGNLAGEPTALIERALKLNPAHQKSLALAASAAMRANQKDIAIGYWQRLRATLPPDSPTLAEIDGVLAELGAPASAPAAATGNQAEVKSSGSIVSGVVNISAELKNKVASGATLFIYARRPLVAGAPAGSRMPLAVARFQLNGSGTFPQSFELTDAMAMAPGNSLSDADEVEITARLSLSGNAMPASGDLSSAPLITRTKGAAQKLNVIINQVVP